MQPGGQAKRARLPSQEYGMSFFQAKAMEKIESRSTLAVFQLDLFELQESGSAGNHRCAGTVVQQGSWRQRIAQNFSRLGPPDAECLSLQRGVRPGPGVERTNAIVQRDGRLAPVQETVEFLQHGSVGR